MMIDKCPRFSGKKVIKNEAIWWVKDSHGTIIIDTEKNKYWLLSGFEESLWQQITIQNSFEEIIKYIERCLQKSNHDSIELFENQIMQWTDRGFIQIVEI